MFVFILIQYSKDSVQFNNKVKISDYKTSSSAVKLELSLNIKCFRPQYASQRRQWKVI